MKRIRSNRGRLHKLEDRLAPALFTVTDLGDAGVGVGTTGDLRYCLAQANIQPGADSITFDPSLFLSGSQTIALTTSIDIIDDVTLIGPGAGLLTIESLGQADRHFRITGPGAINVEITKLKFINGRRTGGLTTDRGGSIFIENENVIIRDSVFVGNSSTASRGGALALQSGGSLQVINTVFGDNSASLSGGAVFIGGGTVTMTDVTFSKNTSTAGGAVTGGAMEVTGSAKVTVIHGAFDGNTAKSAGAIRVAGATLVVRDSVISKNSTSSGRGGGIYSTGESSVTIERTSIVENTNGGAVGGGGLAIMAGSLTVVDSTLSGNKAGSRGGGMYISNTNARIERTTLNNNQATTFGGGISSVNNRTDQPLIIRNTTISGNTAVQGGGVSTYLPNGLVYIQNSTIVNNQATSATANQGGGGVVRHGTGAGTTFIESTIVSGNSAVANGPDLLGLFTATNSLIQNPADFTLNPASVDNLLAVDPQLGPLTKLPGAWTAVHVPDGTSPVIDAGSNPASGRATDQRGAPRTFGPADIGAVERITAGIPTAAADLADIAGDGLSQYQFTVRLEDDAAIDVATLGDNDFRVTGPNGFDQPAKLVNVSGPSGPVVLATYAVTAPGGTFQSPNIGTYTVTVEASAIADLTGNFVPAGQLGRFRIDVTTLTVTNVDDAGPGSLRRAIADANTVLTPNVIVFDPALFSKGARTITLTSEPLSVESGMKLVGPGRDLLTISGGGALRILQIDNPMRYLVDISAVTFADAKRGGTLVADRGAAVRVGDESVTFTGVRFLNNAVSTRGAAVAVESLATVLLDRCEFKGNVSQNSGFTGGALNLVGGSVTTVRDSVFRANTANGFGGAIYVENATLVVEGSTFVENKVTGTGSNGKGGAIQVNYTGTAAGLPVTIRNSTFSSNQAATAGGAINTGNYKGTLLVQNTTLTLNSAPTGGGMNVVLDTGGAAKLQSTLVAGNAATTGPDIATNPGFTISVGSSLIGDADGAAIVPDGFNQIGSGAGGLVINAKLGPLGDNGGPTPTHPLRPGSPAIDSGSNPANLTTDQRGKSRASGTGPDVGAFELNAPFVEALIVGDGTAQRSMVTQVAVRFDQEVSFTGLPVEAFTLTRTGPTGPVDLAGSVAVLGGRTIVTLTFSGPLAEGAASLIDGNYKLEINPFQVGNGNNFLDGEGTGTPGTPYAAGFHRLFGDADGDRTVNFGDFLAFRTAFGLPAGDPNYNPAFDFDGVNGVNFTDFLAFRTRFGTSLAPAP